jgi:hypothetical protein
MLQLVGTPTMAKELLIRTSSKKLSKAEDFVYNIPVGEDTNRGGEAVYTEDFVYNVAVGGDTTTADCRGRCLTGHFY